MARNCQGCFLGAMTSWSLSILIGVCPARRPRWDWFKYGPPLLMEGWVEKKPVEHCLEALGDLINQEVIQLCVLKHQMENRPCIPPWKAQCIVDVFQFKFSLSRPPHQIIFRRKECGGVKGSLPQIWFWFQKKNEALCGKTESSQDIL